jgi:hypothetical protein
MRMPRLIAGLVTAGLLGVAPLAISAPAHADNLTTTSTLEVSAPLVQYGDDVYFNGRVTGSDGLGATYGTASLQVLTPANPVWTTVATDDSPSFVSLYDVVPATNSQYRVVYSGYTAQNAYQDTYAPSESAPVAVGVARAIKAKTPGLRVVGKVAPDYAKKKVKVLRKVGKNYKPFKTVKTNKKSKFSVKLPAGKRGKRLYFRLYIAGDASYSTTVADYYTIRY